jgi:hypothetical protein
MADGQRQRRTNRYGDEVWNAPKNPNTIVANRRFRL